MVLNENIALLFIYIGMIVLSPFAFKFFRTLARYIFNRFIADEIIDITYMKNGCVVSRVRIKTKSDGSTVSKIRNSSGGKLHE